MTLVFITVAVCLLFGNERSFVEPAPVNEGPSHRESAPIQDSSVKELENLKHSIGKTLAMMKTQSAVYRETNGEKEAHAERQEELSEDGKLVAKLGQQVDLSPKEPTKLKTELEVPAKGIHKSVIEEITQNGNRRSTTLVGDNAQVDNTLTTLQYSPLDMAEYVFWTGDEKGVTVAIEEFLQEGLMSREEAISFLQEIKYNLDYLKNHYGSGQLGLNAAKEQLHSRIQGEPEKYPEKPDLKSAFEIRPETNKKREPEVARATPVLMKTSDVEKAQDEDYDELLDRLRMADFLYTEYSLEEVIYQLAKVMFTQSLTRGNVGAQQALQKFTNFLETEAEQGHISRALEKKVLDVLIASLSDTLAEHPELLSAARESLRTSSNTDGHFLRQILEISPEEKIRAERNGLLQDQNLKNRLLPVGIGKYKNP